MTAILTNILRASLLLILRTVPKNTLPWVNRRYQLIKLVNRLVGPKVLFSYPDRNTSEPEAIKTP